MYFTTPTLKPSARRFDVFPGRWSRLLLMGQLGRTLPFALCERTSPIRHIEPNLKAHTTQGLERIQIDLEGTRSVRHVGKQWYGSVLDRVRATRRLAADPYGYTKRIRIETTPNETTFFVRTSFMNAFVPRYMHGSHPRTT
eukprot:scaffold116_cov334-Pavlova_lutheri.AAC.49